MNLVYFSHSYRKEDVDVVTYFGRLMRTEGIVPSLDPPSKTVNASKLERHLNSSDGMLAVVTRREGGVSPHILFEIALGIRARKPVLVFVEDVLSGEIVPSRILQRRFSRGSYLRQLREHRHAIQIFRAYLGENPRPRYQPSTSRRSCLLLGTESMGKAVRRQLPDYIEARGYTPLTTRPQRSLSDEMEVFELIANADVAVCYIDAANRHSHYLLGAVRAALVPTIAITKKKDYEFHGNIPREYQPRVVDANEWTTVEETLGTELTICEQDFVELDDQAEVEKYASLLLEVASSTGEYRPATRNIFIEELIMRDQYKVGQGGAIGPGAQAHHIKFQQIWQGGGNNLNLEALASELSRLRTSMKEVAASPEQDSAIGEVAAAEVAARKGDGAGMLSRLAGAGQWALDVATKIGVSVASEALKKAIGQ